MKKDKLICLAISGVLMLLSGLMGCAHGHRSGTIALKHNDQEADVCIDGSGVKAGDRVSLFKNECNVAGNKGTQPSCKRVKVGEGSVVSVLDGHYSSIHVDSGVTFSVGTIVEKE